MLPKQKEMDEAIESIYEIISTQDAESLANDPKAKGTLIVICGDHGMNEVSISNSQKREPKMLMRID